jgi:hypothetical protein
LPVAAISHRSGNRQPKTYVKSEAPITVSELLMMGVVPPETCWAIKKQWNKKFYYTVASCWFFLWNLYYDARIHEHQTHSLCLSQILVMSIYLVNSLLWETIAFRILGISAQWCWLTNCKQ